MRLLPRSLFGRMVVVQFTVGLLLAALLPLLISHLLISTTNAFVGRELDRSAMLLRGKIAYGPGGWTFTTALPPMFDSRQGIRNVRVIDATRRVWLSQGPYYRVPVAQLPLGATHAHRLWDGVDVATYPIQSAGHRAWLVLSSDRRRPESLVASVTTSFLDRFLWIVPALILCSLVLTLLFLAQGTRAIRRGSRRADAIGAGSLDVRLDLDGLPLEVQPLARAMNEALDRVENSYSEQAEFASSVAHELRNPLATIACRIEEISDPLLRQRMKTSLTHAAHVIDQLMMLARMGGEQMDLGPVDLRSVTLQALEESAPRIIANGRTIEFDHDPKETAFTVRADEGLVRLSLDNLIDNAQRHTPEGTHIYVSLGPGPQLLVRDDGPGIEISDRHPARHRSRRESNRRSDSTGLGLSIVTRAMQAQNGSLQICDSRVGAAVALIFCPAAV